MSSGLLLDIRRLVFYRPDYQKFSMCPLIKRLGRTFVSNNAAEPLKRSAGLLKHSAELLRVYKKTKSSAERLKSSVACLGYNAVHAVTISQGTVTFLIEKCAFLKN